jgi:hypothetical protein
MALTGAKADNFETGLLNYIFLGTTTNVHTGTNLWVGLFTSNAGVPAIADAAQYAAYEPDSANGYQRVQVSAAFSTVAANGAGDLPASISNDALMDFGTSTNSAGWGSVTGFFITTGTNAQANGVGNDAMMYYGTFDTPRIVSTGDSVRINTTNLTIKEK